MLLEKTITVQAPAKINLRLKIVGRRADGYHLLSMLNSTIGLFDQLEFLITTGKGNVELESVLGLQQQSLGQPQDNLAFRAAKLFFHTFQINNNDLKIKLTKKIPVGAGLGGGSSDGTATLLALSNYFFPEMTDQSRIKSLSGIALELGSDLPFFLYQGLCRVSGIGEQLQQISVNHLSGKPFLLISPQIHLSTQAIFKAFALENPTTVLLKDKFIPDILSYSQIADLIENDLLEVIKKNSGICQSLISHLNQLPNVVTSVTGSGSSIFCLPKKEYDSQALKDVQQHLEQFKSSILINSQIVQFL